ncbi:MAG: KamA family radical SAM protein [Syntrophales bacterium]
MESETLFVEEAEPPGRLTDIVGPNQYSEHVGSSLNTLYSPTAVPVRPVSRLTFSNDSRSRAFRKRFFPNITLKEWQDWHWQLRNRIRDMSTLDRMIHLSEDERHAMSGSAGSLPLAITPYYASLLDPWNQKQALRRTVVPTVHEHFRSNGEEDDPLHEDEDSPVPGIVHRYPDRVLFLVTGICSTYCRYCTRSRMVGHHGNHCLDTDQWEKGIEYIAAHPEVRDVLLSGGDPLTLADAQLEWLLMRLRRIPHVELIRIGTKAPAVLPQRITPALVKMLKRYHPLWISIHAAHPDELTPEMSRACTRLADAGIPLGSQTVLLSGINDDVDTMKRLVQGLLKIRVKPYYLYQCDPIPGSSHFRTPIAKGLDVIRGLRGFTTGYAVPTYVVDAPGGGGKIPLLPEYVVGQEDGDLLLRNYEGNIFRYPDCPSTESVIH